MSQSNIGKAIKTTRAANAIMIKAGGAMVKTSFRAMKQIASLYREAGSRAFDLGKEVVKQTVDIAVDNQKELIKTSGQAFKEVTQSIRTQEEKKAGAKKATTAAKGKKTKLEKKAVSIDDLLE
ncbi:MAG: hypothetical protein KTR30_00835 [Saprospiraceae bacterium]|nr:hypothetical protein [Saprospiraceae bacterium]